jgi:outer membrane lipoprotein-sorting protein
MGKNAQVGEGITMRDLILRIILIALCFGVGAERAQSPDVKELKNKLEKLEQMMQDLKQEIADAESAQKITGQPLVPTATAKPLPYRPHNYPSITWAH